MQRHAIGLETCSTSARSSAPDLRDHLRSATSEVHERLHHHPGLAAVQTGMIGKTAYTALLRRLYGFHRPFEMMAGLLPVRTIWLERDLIDLGVDPGSIAFLPHALAFPAQASPEYLLGARYVVEGSALGGRGLARQLDGLLGHGVTAGRRFFAGHGAETGAQWRAYLDQLWNAPTGLAAQTESVAGATRTFAIFEQWLEGWNDWHD
ncbi:biliverdin-producing heme oxygenase [Novosphingobium sp. Chol11]|uniref:biliverdin-producing heme oxygenase n=1 Tax=Novosphingobium sp. Chol11 TaxID=1385763 RepID=UPI0025E434EE|nr:biliverdin-producing heme oxygenase [Novosphingobium sp. Chol11]